MKFRRILCALFGAVFFAFSFAACGEKHEHTWTSYIAKQPTCTEKGILERVCEECSKQSFEEIAPSGHNFGQDGICEICGAGKTAEDAGNHIELTDPDIGYSLKDIYDICMDSFGYKNSFETFLEYIGKGYVQGMYEDTLKLVHFDIFQNGTGKEKQTEFSLALEIDRESVTAPKPELLKTIFRVYLSGGELTVLYTDGTNLNAGNALSNEYENEPLIVSVFLNKTNQVAVVYEDGTALFVGKISDGVIPENHSNFVYRECEGGYEILGAVNSNVKSLDIPLTFHGKPVVKIAKSAFESMKNLKSVTIGGNIRYIDDYAFDDCTSLSYIVIPKTVEKLGYFVFFAYVNTVAPVVYFEGAQSDYDLHIYYKTGNVTAYFKGEWDYVNGIPVAR